jgi:hypothetical protein
MVSSWFPGATLDADHSWDLVDRAVLHIDHDGTDVLVKAGGPDDHHMDREIRAYERWVGPLAGCGRAPTLLNADHRLRLLAVTHLPGALAEGRPELESAFFEGYGDDPREPVRWRRVRLREAVGTAVWAHLVGDAPFEEQGHRMIVDVLRG